MSDWDTLKFSFRESNKKLEGIIKEGGRILTESIRRSKSVGRGIADKSSLLELAIDLSEDYMKSLHDCESSLDRIQSTVIGGNAARVAQLQRFRETLQQQKREWSRVQDSISTERNKHELFSGHRNSSDSFSHHETSANQLLQERGSLVQSLGIVDETLSSAHITSEMLRKQKATIGNFGAKLTNLTSTIPGINSLMSRISLRQFQEKLLLSLVLGVCISILLWMRVLR